MRRIFTLSVLVALTIAGAAIAQEKATYIGVSKCKMCHNKPTQPIYTTWAATPHANALAALEKADDKVTAEWAAKIKADVKGPAAKAPACLKCHVVGFGAGGYTGADSTKDAGFAAVGCEDCHGPGSKHLAAPMAEKKAIMAAHMPNEETCKTCHTAATSPKFDFAEYMKKGMHVLKATGKS